LWGTTEDMKQVETQDNRTSAMGGGPPLFATVAAAGLHGVFLVWAIKWVSRPPAQCPHVSRMRQHVHHLWHLAGLGIGGIGILRRTKEVHNVRFFCELIWGSRIGSWQPFMELCCRRCWMPGL